MVDINPADDVPARAGAPSPPGPAFFWSGTNRIRDVAGDARLHRRPREYEVACSRMPAVGNPSARYRAFHAVSRSLTDRSMGARPGQHASGIRAVEVLIELSRC